MGNVQRIGYFDEHPSIHSAEDSDWGYRALKSGIPIVYNPEIVLRHYGWRDESQRASRYFDYARSQGAFFGKYLFSGDLLIPLQVGQALLRAPLRWMRGLARKDEDMIARGRADTLYLIPGLLAGMRRKRV
jgi:GT2 family glycosyltransferase